MKNNEYVKMVNDLESIVNVAEVDESFEDVCRAYAALGEVLDGYKRSIFYGTKDRLTEKKVPKMYEAFKHLNNAIRECGTQDSIPLKLNTRYVHAILGLATESAELLENIINKKDIDLNAIEELGDCQFYVVVGADAAAQALKMPKNCEDCVEWVMNVNHSKLAKKRFKSGKFSQDEAINRDINSEATEMEETIKNG